MNLSNFQLKWIIQPMKTYFHLYLMIYSHWKFQRSKNTKQNKQTKSLQIIREFSLSSDNYMADLGQMLHASFVDVNRP